MSGRVRLGSEFEVLVLKISLETALHEASHPYHVAVKHRQIEEERIRCAEPRLKIIDLRRFNWSRLENPYDVEGLRVLIFNVFR